MLRPFLSTSWGDWWYGPEKPATAQNATSAVSQTPKTLGANPADAKVSGGPVALGGPGDAVSLPQNAMERMKQELLDYADNLQAHKKKFSDLREQALLLETPETQSNAPKPQTSLNAMPIQTAVKGLDNKIQNVEAQAQTLIAKLLKDIPQLHDVPSVIELCKDANKLIGQLDVGIVEVKGWLQDARDQKPFFRNLLTWMLAWKGVSIQSLIPASVDDRNDDKLYQASKSHMEDFFEWLSDVKIRLKRAETAAEVCLAQITKEREMKADSVKPASGNTAALVSKVMAFTPVGVSDSAAANATATGVSVDGPQASQTSNATAQRAQSPAPEQQRDMGGLELGSEHIPQPPPISPRRLGGAAV